MLDCSLLLEVCEEKLRLLVVDISASAGEGEPRDTGTDSVKPWSIVWGDDGVEEEGGRRARECILRVWRDLSTPTRRLRHLTTLWRRPLGGVVAPVPVFGAVVVCGTSAAAAAEKEIEGFGIRIAPPCNKRQGATPEAAAIRRDNRSFRVGSDAGARKRVRAACDGLNSDLELLAGGVENVGGAGEILVLGCGEFSP